MCLVRAAAGAARVDALLRRVPALRQELVGHVVALEDELLHAAARQEEPDDALARQVVGHQPEAAHPRVASRKVRLHEASDVGTMAK